MEETGQPSTPGNGLIYGLNDRPPFKEAFFAALQHLLAIFVAIITPPLIIAGALKLDAETTGYLVSMALFASGISTFVQCRRFGCIGTGLLCIQGTSFSFIGPNHSGRHGRRIAADIRLVHGGFVCGDGHQPCFEVHPAHHYSAYFRHRGDSHRHEPYQGGHHSLWGRGCGTGRWHLWLAALRRVGGIGVGAYHFLQP